MRNQRVKKKTHQTDWEKREIDKTNGLGMFLVKNAIFCVNFFLLSFHILCIYHYVRLLETEIVEIINAVHIQLQRMYAKRTLYICFVCI